MKPDYISTYAPQYVLQVALCPFPPGGHLPVRDVPKLRVPVPVCVVPGGAECGEVYRSVLSAQERLAVYSIQGKGRHCRSVK